MTVYLFGEFCDGYTQYPDDAVAQSLKGFSSMMKANTQIAIRRDGNLMYYAYMRKLTGTQYCGICVVEADQYYTGLDRLFSAFEECTEKLAYSGNIIHFDAKGDLTSDVTQLSARLEESIVAISVIEEVLHKAQIDTCTLPPVNYAVLPTSVYFCSVGDDSVVRSSYTFGTTVILKDSDYNTVNHTHYNAVLDCLNQKVNELIRNNKELQTDLKRTRHQKRQYAKVVLLSCIVLLAGMVAYNEHAELILLQEENKGRLYKLDEANKTIVEKDLCISNQRDSIEYAEDAMTRLTFKATSLKDGIERQTKFIDSLQANVATKENSLMHQDAEIKLQKSEICEQSAEIKKLQNLLANLNKDKRDMEADKTKLIAENKRLREKNAKAQKNVKELETDIKKYREELGIMYELMTKASSYSPFIVTSCTANSTSCKVSYYGNEAGAVNITVNTICSPNGITESISKTHNVQIRPGYHECEFPFPHVLPHDSKCYVQIIYKDNIVAGKFWIN